MRRLVFLIVTLIVSVFFLLSFGKLSFARDPGKQWAVCGQRAEYGSKLILFFYNTADGIYSARIKDNQTGEAEEIEYSSQAAAVATYYGYKVDVLGYYCQRN